MKTPPFLLFCGLLFWGWQSNLLWCGAAAGVLLEASRLVRRRWELEDVDFNRIFSLCMLTAVGVGAYIFTTSDEGGGLTGMLGNGFTGLRHASNSSATAGFTVFRWLPLILLPFVAAQIYNLRPSVPLTAVSMVLRIRRRRGEQSLAGRYIDFSHAYFLICLFSAGIHANRATYGYFCGLVILIPWALRAQSPRRFGWKTWAAGLTGVVLAGFLGLLGVRQMEQVIQNFDAELMQYFMRSRTNPMQSTTAIGRIGELKLSPRIVIRVEPARTGVVPPYLREASYRTYHYQNWYVGGANNSNSVSCEPDHTSWVLAPHKNTNTTVKIACYLNGRSTETHDPEGVLPLPPGCFRLESLPELLSIISLQVNDTGDVLATGAGLLIFDARYGPGATFDAPPDESTNRFDLSVPTNELPALRQVITELDLTNAAASDAEKRLAVQAFFARKFAYSTWQGLDKRASGDVSPLTKFLLTSRHGHCEYFATATVLLLRALGIPARYAVGYAVHEASGSGYVVRDRDAHAWCLVWNQRSRAWEDFDTTPASWVAIEGQNTSYLDFFSDMRSWLTFQFQKLRWRQSNVRQYIIWTIAPVMVVLLYYILFKRRGRLLSSRRAATPPPAPWPGLDSAFYGLEKALAARGLPREPQQALSDWLERVLAETALTPFRAPVRELLRLHYRYRFDPRGLDPAARQSLMEKAGTLSRELTQP